MKRILLFAFSLAVITSCGTKKTEDKSTTGDTSVTNKEPEERPEKVTAAFEIEQGDTEEEPKSTISVNVNGTKTEIATISGLAEHFDKKDYAQYEVPADATDACGCWWAGGGDYFYLLSTASGVDVYTGWQDEGQEDTGYHWKKTKTF